MKNKEDQKYCHWRNLCSGESEYLCCSFCTKLTCNFRCVDNCKTCGYLTTKDNITQLNAKSFGNNTDFSTWEPKKNKKDN